MKRVLSVLTIIALCISLCACSCATDTSTTKAQAPVCDETTIRTLAEQNFDCYFLYYVSPLANTTQQNSDGYLGTDQSFFKTYDELENLIKTTYVSTKATELFEYPSKETPLYKDVQNLIFVKPDLVEFEKYDIIWDTYTVDITSTTDTKCEFTLRTTTLDDDVYKTNGTASLENGKWLLDDMIY